MCNLIFCCCLNLFGVKMFIGIIYMLIFLYMKKEVKNFFFEFKVV